MKKKCEVWGDFTIDRPQNIANMTNADQLIVRLL